MRNRRLAPSHVDLTYGPLKVETGRKWQTGLLYDGPTLFWAERVLELVF